MQSIPGIRGELPHSQRDASLLRVHIKNHALDLISNIDQLRGMLHALGPGHLADVNQPFDSLLQLYERAVVGNADHSPGNVRAYRIAVRSIQPRVRSELLESQRNALLVFVKLQHFHLDLIAYVHQVAGMREPPPGHIGNVQQAINAAEVDERAVFSKIFDYSREHRALFQMLQRFGFLLVLFLFQNLLARDDDVAALLV